MFGMPFDVEGLINETSAGSKERKELLEQRVSMLRLSPLMATIIGARMEAEAQLQPGSQMPNPTGHQPEVAKLLLEAGARVDSKDIAG